MKKLIFLLAASLICFACGSKTENGNSSAEEIKSTKGHPMYYSEASIISNCPIENNDIKDKILILGSYDLISRVVDSLPFMNVEYMMLGRGCMRMYYRQTPLVIEAERIHPSAYDKLYEIKLKGDSLHISSADDGVDLHVDAPYGELMSCHDFDARVYPTEYMLYSGKVYFRFRNQESLVHEFKDKLEIKSVEEGSTALALGLISEVPQRDCEFLNKLCELFFALKLGESYTILEEARPLRIIQ